MKIITSLLSVVLLAGCSGSTTQRTKRRGISGTLPLAPPKALPAEVTLVKIADIEGYGHIYRTIDQPQGSSVGTWDQFAGLGSSPFNYAKAPPNNYDVLLGFDYRQKGV